MFIQPFRLEIASFRIDHFTVVCSVAWPLDGSEAGVDLVLIDLTVFVLENKLF